MPSVKHKKDTPLDGGRNRGRTKNTQNTSAGNSKAVDRQLARYREMRNFEATSEPKGDSGRNVGEEIRNLPFVIQKHAATRLHYDFRLGWRGVLKSWAVTKGPSYYPGDKRLAVQVEDHPLEYGGFEGIIPRGQYGGGTVMLWDEGTWTPHGDADEGLKIGRLKFTLHGKKLRGDWALIRMGGKAAQEKKSNWLLIKEHDKFERGNDDPPVVEEEPDSVVTGRNLDAIARNRDHVWNSHRNATTRTNHPAPKVGEKRAGTSQKMSRGNNSLKSVPIEALPRFVAPQLALQVSEVPEGVDWLHELKLDGYRIQGRIDTSQKRGSSPVTLITRGGLDWTHRMPDITDTLTELPVKSALLDGEVVVFDDKGGTSFALLQAAFQEGKKQQLTYAVFDLLHLDGHNLRELTLDRRKLMLRELLGNLGDPDTVFYSEHLGMHGQQIFQKACELGAEGIVSKRASSQYHSGRSSAWLKVKCVRRQEFVIGGFTLPSKSGVGIGALLLGYYRDGKLIYAGRTGTGFTQKVRKDMRARLDAIRQDNPPFAIAPSRPARDVRWVQPKFVCEVHFATWTADNLVRQASFQGLREDKPAKEVTREVSVDLEKAMNGSTDIDEPKKKSTKKQNHRKKTTPTNSSNETQNLSGKRNASRSSPFPIALTHPDKQVDSETKLTKREIADYFWAVRESMLPYISNRPLSIVRCPRGSTQPCFYQKHVTASFPEEVDGIDIRGRKSGSIETYITLSTPLALAGLAQMGVIEIHPWGSRNSDIEKPDMLIFDLDPDDAIDWKTLAESAREVRSRLRKCKLQSFVKTTGGKGLHVVAPIQPEHEWPVVKEFAHRLARQMESENRQLYIAKMTKAARKGKIYVDYLRNERGATSIAPYSPRARKSAPVAVPLAWSELDGGKVPRFLVADFDKWKGRLRDDPWKKMLATRQSLRPDMLSWSHSERGESLP